MRIDNRKLDILLAERCMNRGNLRNGTSPQTLKRASKGAELKPKTVGRIAKALGVSVTDILADSEQTKEVHT